MKNSTYDVVLKEQVVIKFIAENPSRKDLIYNYFYKEDRFNNDLLNREFRKYFYKIRLIKYVVTLCERFSTYYRTTFFKKMNREPLVLDRPVVDESAINVIDTIASHSDESRYCLDTIEKGFKGIVSSEETLKKIDHLNDLQKIILWRSVVLGKSLKEISGQLDVSVQNVSQIKKRTILKLRGGINE